MNKKFYKGEGDLGIVIVLAVLGLAIYGGYFFSKGDSIGEQKINKSEDFKPFQASADTPIKEVKSPSFEEKQVCAKYISRIKMEIQDKKQTRDDPQWGCYYNGELKEIFYSEKQQSCVYFLQESYNCYRDKNVTNLMTYSLIDALTEQIILSENGLFDASKKYDNSSEDRQAYSRFRDLYKLYK